MSKTSVAAILLVVLCGFAAAADGEVANKTSGLRFEAVSDQSLGVWEGERPVLVYNLGMISRPKLPGASARACYIHPVYGLDGEVLSDDFPKDHLYHRGIYWAWSHVTIGEREYDLWSAKGDLRQVFHRWVNKEASTDGAQLKVENRWVAGEKELVREVVSIHVHPATADSRAIDVELTWVPIGQPLKLAGAKGKSYGGFNFRFAPRTKTVITVPTSSVLPEGLTAPDGRTSGDLLVTKLPWADFAGDFPRGKDLSGAAIFIHPQHPDYPPTWMTRHYGLLSVGWPGVQPQTFPANQLITCRYRVWIHRGLPEAAQIQAEYEKYAQSKNQAVD